MVPKLGGQEQRGHWFLSQLTSAGWEVGKGSKGWLLSPTLARAGMGPSWEQLLAVSTTEIGKHRFAGKLSPESWEPTYMEGTVYLGQDWKKS